jgi:hypothetical protein
MRILLCLLLSNLVVAQSTSPTPRAEQKTNEYEVIQEIFIGVLALAVLCTCVRLHKYYRTQQTQTIPAGADIVVLTHENYLSLIRERPTPALSDSAACSICLENAKTIAFVSCGHSVCADCNQLLLNANSPCPLCRLPIQSRLHLY